MNEAQVKELLLQSLEQERVAVKIYKAAVGCALRADLKIEWNRFLGQTEEHVGVLTLICESFDLDPLARTPGTQIVKAHGKGLIAGIEDLSAAGNPNTAQLLAAENIVLAETRIRLNWELIAAVARACEGQQRELMTAACEVIEGEGDEHLFNSQGWLRELWLESLGLEAALPKSDAPDGADAPENLLYVSDYLQSRH